MTGRTIVCVAPVEWTWVWQRYHEIMRRLAREGNRVLVIEHLYRPAPTLLSLPRAARRAAAILRSMLTPSHSVEPGVAVLSALSVGQGRISRITTPLWLSRLRRALRDAGDAAPVLWVGFPTPAWPAIVDAVRPRLIVYDCASAFAADPGLPEAVVEAEAALLKSADLVFTDAYHLWVRHARVHPRCHWIPTGVNFAEFSSDGSAPTPALPHPVIGYVGTMHAWMDVDLIQSVASAHPQWTFVFVGPRRERAHLDAVLQLPNVRLYDPVPHKMLPGVLRQFDVAWIPYKVTEFTQYVFPTKLMEYLAAGRPVVSTDLAEVRRFSPPVRVGRSADEIGSELDAALHGGDGKGREIARRFDWSLAMEKIHDHLNRALGEEAR